MRSPTLSPAGSGRTSRLRPGIPALVLAVATLLGLATSAHALLRLDFEQKYYHDPGRQVWDFSILRTGTTFHIFYHAIPEATPGAANADTIWHATSSDLRHWEPARAVLTSVPDSWKPGAVWAPDVFYNEAAGYWVIAYTGCDLSMNQRIGTAFSYDLEHWYDLGLNPAVVPDSTQYIWSAAGSWGDFRDPYVYRSGGLWHMLVTAKKSLDVPTGVIYHATSTNLSRWYDMGPLFANDGTEKWRVLESCQYHVIGQTHHLLFGEFDTAGTTILSAASPDQWTMADRRLLDYGYAPEIDEIAPGVRIFSRLAPYLAPDGTTLRYVVRIDTLTTEPDGSNLQVYKPHPLEANWEVRSGTSNLGNPVYGDNPLWRDEPSVGLVGNGWYGSQEYYQGPLSGRGAPGTKLGDGVTGRIESYPFVVTGNRMRLLVGGGHYPATCYVGLVDTADGTLLLSETGDGTDPMTPRQWDLRPYRGRTCRIVIVDQETGLMGHINVDEIIEEMDLPAAVDAPSARFGAVTDVCAVPNPFNPLTEIRFALDRQRSFRVAVYDLAGRLVWDSGPRAGAAGLNRVRWDGRASGGPAAAGAYVYRIVPDGAAPVTGKISLVK